MVTIKRKLFIGYLALVLLVAVFAGCASTPQRESAGEFVDDVVITTKVKALLAADNLLKSFKISVETFKGRVYLSGLVDYPSDIDRADEIAATAQGVRSVKNNLIVK